MIYAFLKKDFLEPLGVHDWGMTTQAESVSYPEYRNAIEKKMHLPLSYLEGEKAEKRQSLQKYFPEFQTSISFVFPYWDQRQIDLEQDELLPIASYVKAYEGQDYHIWIREKLNLIIAEMKKTFPHGIFKISLDTQPILERDLAYRSGLGWFGKNSMLINRHYGSYFILASIMIDQKLDLHPRKLDLDHCGQCNACVEACPTNAIDGELRTLIASQCIATYTIEQFKDSDPAPKGMEKSRGEIFGCDICQDVCPWNKKKLKSVSNNSNVYLDDSRFNKFNKHNLVNVIEWIENMSNRAYQKYFKNTPLERTGRIGMLKNLKFYKNLSILILALFISCSPQKEVLIVKQWHLSPGASTLNVEESQKLPQFANQFDLYQTLATKTAKGNMDVIISEGCEGEINEASNLDHYGWDFNKLKQKSDDSDYAKILALPALKLKVKFPKLIAVCGDNTELIEKNQLAFSDLKGYMGYYQRLVENRGKNERAFQSFKRSLEELLGKEVENPVAEAKVLTHKSLETIENLIAKRNDSFIQQIKSHPNKKIAVVIGGLHIKDLTKKLENQKIKYKIYTPEGYENQDESLLAMLKIQFQGLGMDYKLEYFQIPEGFDLSKFTPRNLIPIEKLFNESDVAEILPIAKEVGIPLEILQSDFDGDGVRDFTISMNQGKVVLAAEDNDWDGDGIPNMLDDSLGQTEIGKISSIVINNKYNIKGISQSELLQFFKTSAIHLLNSSGQGHDIIVLEVLRNILKKIALTHFNVITFHATEPKVLYGHNVFFAYVKGSQSLEFYPDRFHHFLNSEYNKKFKGAPFDQFIKEVAVPILVHSLLHELAHSTNIPIEVTKNFNWAWKSKKSESLYGKAYRLKEKEIDEIPFDVKLRGKTYQDYQNLKRDFEQEIVNLRKKSNNSLEYQKFSKKSFWYTGVDSSEEALQLSFLAKEDEVSFYALSSPHEWLAENLAACWFLDFYPKTINLYDSLRFEQLIGFYPRARKKALCEKLAPLKN
jgi:epoxyqueuosine reductase